MRNVDANPKARKCANSSMEMDDNIDGVDGEERAKVPRSTTLVSSMGQPN